MEKKIFDIIFDKDEITWQSLIYELIRTNQMDPWDIDVSMLTKEYIKMLKKLKKLDFRVSGKVLIAAVLLLKIQSNRLIGEDIQHFDDLFNQEEMTEQEFYDELETELEKDRRIYNNVKLIPKMPQPRKRKVSIYDLINALNSAIETEKRKVLRSIKVDLDIKPPEKKIDITELLKNIYQRIRNFFKKNKTKLTFSKLVPSDKKEDIIYTLLPLLHLETQRKINMIQEKPFEDIEIKLNKK